MASTRFVGSSVDDVILFTGSFHSPFFDVVARVSMRCPSAGLATPRLYMVLRSPRLFSRLITAVDASMSVGFTVAYISPAYSCML